MQRHIPEDQYPQNLQGRNAFNFNDAYNFIVLIGQCSIMSFLYGLMDKVLADWYSNDKAT